jgi:hypothetical protein
MHSDAIWSVAWAGNNMIVTGSVDETINVWCVLGEEGAPPCPARGGAPYAATAQPRSALTDYCSCVIVLQDDEPEV